MKIAVTGGSGLLGTAVLRRLLADRKNREIRCLDRRPPVVPLGRVRFTEVDIRDPDLARCFAGCEVVVHLAAVVTAYVPRAELDAINVGGTRTVFDAAAAAGVQQVIYSSSLAAYGMVPGHAIPLVESAPRRRDPQLGYAASKFDVEEWLDTFEAAHPEVAVVRLRPGVVIGERIENPLGSALRRGLMPDGGGTPMPSVWDEDVADAVALAIATRARGAFNLVAAEPATATQIARAVGLRRLRLPQPVTRALGRASMWATRFGFRPRVDPAWLRVPPDCDMTASSERAIRELGWQPRCPTTISVYQRFVDSVPRRLDRRLAVFFRLLDAAARRRPPPDEARTVQAHVHLALSGRRGGDVALRFDEGRLSVTLGHVPRPPSSVVRLSAETLLALLAGETDLARAELTGKVRIDGEPAAAMLLGGIVATFRAARGQPGAPGFAVRRLSHWFKEAA